LPSCQFWPASSQANVIILGNLPALNDASGGLVDAGTDDIGSIFRNIRQAVSFTMPAVDAAVQNVALRLDRYNTDAGDVAVVGFFEDNGSDEPGSLHGSLMVSPPSSNDDIGQFNFIPSAPLTLSASTKYWLVLDATAGEYEWRRSAPIITPTSQIGTTFGRAVTITPDSVDDTFGPSSFEIDSTAPEPPAIHLALVATGVVVGSVRASKGRRLTAQMTR
jgi:hypothetical protein